MKNILFSSTRQWNPGDDIILFGVRNLLLDAGHSHNAILYNRAPLLTQAKMGKPLDTDIEDDKFGVPPQFFDNSYIEHEMCDELIDYVVFAGTPEWTGPNLVSLVDLLWNRDIRFSLIGVGGRQNLDARFRCLLENQCDLAITRDGEGYNTLKSFGADVYPCPSLFSSRHLYQKTELKSIGFCFQGPRYCSAPPIKMYERIVTLGRIMLEKYDMTIICHSIIDLMYAEKKFPGANILYSSYAEDYFDIYKDFDLIVGARIHGAGIASSLCIPSITIWHCSRSDTVQPLGSVLVQDSDVLDAIGQIDIAAMSVSLCGLRKFWHKEYMTRLMPLEI